MASWWWRHGSLRRGISLSHHLSAWAAHVLAAARACATRGAPLVPFDFDALLRDPDAIKTPRRGGGPLLLVVVVVPRRSSYH